MRLYRAGRVDGLNAITSQDVSDFKCESCIMGKGTRLPSPPAEDIRASKPGELIHFDLWGPATATSIGGARYFLTCYDDYSRKVHLSFLKQKSDAFSAIKSYIALVECQLGTKVKALRSDNGGEFTSREWDNYIRQLGIQHIRVPPDAHAQNGRVERVHLAILNLVRTYLIDTGLPQSFWAEGASYAAYTRNRTPCGPQSAIPDDKWFGKSKRHIHLHAFGSTAYFRDHRQISKLSPRYRRGLLLGYQEGTHKYRIWDGNKVIITRDTIFPMISGDDLVKSGDGTYSAPIDLKLGDNMRNVRDYTPANSQLDGIKTAGGRNCGDGKFDIHSKERGYNFDDFLGDFHGVLQRNRNREHLGTGGQHHTPLHSPPHSLSRSYSDQQRPRSVRLQG
jgi:hypothetical protein